MGSLGPWVPSLQVLPLCSVACRINTVYARQSLHFDALPSQGLGNNLALTTNCLDMLFVNKALQMLDPQNL